MKTFELTMKLRNNLIKKRRTDLGLTPRQAAEKAGVAYGLWLGYEALTRNPLMSRRRKVKWRDSAIALARFLGEPPELLFPDAVLSVSNSEIVHEIEIDELSALAGYSANLELPSTPEELLCTAEVGAMVRAATQTLTPREARVIHLRYEKDLTLEETGQKLGVHRVRAQQIEAKALRKLRHPARTRSLRNEVT